jgi:chemotaxis protein CheX
MPDVAVKAEHVNPFIKATIETFATIVDMKITPGKVKMKAQSDIVYDVSGIIGLSGGAKGTVALSFPRLVALPVVRAFTGEKVVTNNQMVDAIGEVANIVAGAAKKDLAQYKILISLPTVVMGDKHEVAGPVDAMNLVVPFECPAGKFDLAICFKSLI